MNTHRHYSLLLACICVTVAGCSNPSVIDPVVYIEESDAKMNAALETAKSTFQDFLNNWETMPNDGASVKFALPTSDDGHEHIWFKPTEITDDEITGVCGNDPAKVPGLKFGDVRTFKRSELTDWMILIGNRCYGGYTVRVLAEMEPENAPPFEFEDFPKNAK